MSLLELGNLEVAFGGVLACAGISLDVDAGEIVGVAGPNGSGKTTMFRAACGDVRPTGGHVRWQGKDVTGWSADRIARRGLIRTFQNSAMFPSATVLGSVEMARMCAGHRRVDQAELRLPESVEEVIGFCHLDDVAEVPARSLSMGHLRMLGIAMALMARPVMLLLDEPAAGLTIAEGRDLSVLLREVQSEGVTLMVVDHDMSFLTPLCDRLVILETGAKFIEGDPVEVAANEDVVRLYLGSKFARGKTALEGHVPGAEPVLG